jgi:hypothetical protein
MEEMNSSCHKSVILSQYNHRLYYCKSHTHITLVDTVQDRREEKQGTFTYLSYTNVSFLSFYIVSFAESEGCFYLEGCRPYLKVRTPLALLLF